MSILKSRVHISLCFCFRIIADSQGTISLCLDALIKTTTLKIKRFKEIEKTKEELKNGKTISIKNIDTKESEE